MSYFADMKHGESRDLTLNGHQFKVAYHSRQSYGDNNKPVRGAVVGEYTVTHPNGQVSEHAHGPYALTEQAAKRGASRDSKVLTASHVMSTIQRAVPASVYNDRRKS